ncbi:MAG: rhomboid family intramembrane serine protease [Candidatus Bathyarchaeota archaeon]
MNKTNWLIIICALASLVVWLIGGNQNQILEYLVFSGQNLLIGRVWTLITGLFLHADPTHLIGNMIFFYIFGNTIENELGAKWVVVPFFVGGVGSFLVSTLFYNPNISMIGASAAIFTLTAIVMLLKPLKFSFYFLMPLGLVAIIYFSYNLLAAQINAEGTVSYIGHIIGFSIGIPFGIASSNDWHKNLLITGLLFIIYLGIIWILLPAIGINL